MTSAEVKPELQLKNEEGWLYVQRPESKGAGGSSSIAGWLNHIKVDWDSLARLAYMSLAGQENVALNPDLLSKENINDKFRFKRSDIALQIVNIGIPNDVKHVFNNFKIGKEREAEFQGTKHSEKVYEVTRGELFQIFVAVLARQEMPRTKKQRKKLKTIKKTRKKLQFPSDLLLKPKRHIINTEGSIQVEDILIKYRPRPAVKDKTTLRELEKLMTQKPYSGGPLLNVE